MPILSISDRYKVWNLPARHLSGGLSFGVNNGDGHNFDNEDEGH
jgi:hypothetical protein